jgi:hypothetical protein
MLCAFLKIEQRRSYRHWCNVVNKTPPFLYFSIAKGGLKTIAHLPIVVELSFQRLDMRIYNCNSRNEKNDLIQVRSELSPSTSKLVS